MTSNYDSLYSYFSKRTEEVVSLTFEEIEKILGFELPPSAYKYPAWWSNASKGDHSHSHSWQDAGYKAKGYSSSIHRKKMTFIKSK